MGSFAQTSLKQKISYKCTFNVSLLLLFEKRYSNAPTLFLGLKTIQVPKAGIADLHSGNHRGVIFK